MTAEVVKDAIVVRDGTDWAAAIPTTVDRLTGSTVWFIVDTYNDPSRMGSTRLAIGACTEIIDDDKFAAVWRGVYTKLRTGLRARFELEYPYAPTP